MTIAIVREARPKPPPEPDPMAELDGVIVGEVATGRPGSGQKQLAIRRRGSAIETGKPWYEFNVTKYYPETPLLIFEMSHADLGQYIEALQQLWNSE